MFGDGKRVKIYETICMLKNSSRTNWSEIQEGRHNPVGRCDLGQYGKRWKNISVHFAAGL
jgi:hypothetical protein